MILQDKNKEPKNLQKNIEDKIQKAREKQQQELEFKKQQHQQELEFQKKNNPEFRDYDKEPLVIKDYTLMVFRLFMLLCFGLAFMFAVVKISNLSNNKEPLWLLIILVFYAKEVFLTANCRFIEFKNSYIDYYIGDILQKRIMLYEIEKLYQNSSFQYKYLKERQKVIFVYLYVIVVCIIYPNYIPLFSLGAFLFLCPKFYYQMKFCGKIKFYSSLLIEAKENQINICIVDTNTQEAVKKYF